MSLPLITAAEASLIFPNKYNIHDYQLKDKILLEFIETKELICRSFNDWSGTGYKINMPYLENPVQRHQLLYPDDFIKNIRLNIPLDCIEMVDILIGGQRVNRIFYNLYPFFIKEFHDTRYIRNMTKILSNIICNDIVGLIMSYTDFFKIEKDMFIVPLPVLKDGFPLLNYHEISIIVRLKTNNHANDVRGLVDCYKNNIKSYINENRTNNQFVNQQRIKDGLEFTTSQVQYFDNFEMTYLANINLPVNIIILEVSDKNILGDSLEIILGNYRLTSAISYKIGCFHIYKFDNYINFSLIEGKINMKYPTKLYAINFNIMRCMSGMAGLCWSL